MLLHTRMHVHHAMRCRGERSHKPYQAVTRPVYSISALGNADKACIAPDSNAGVEREHHMPSRATKCHACFGQTADDPHC